MQKTVYKCDACGRVIDTDGMQIRIPHGVQHWYVHTWIELDICDECWCGLKAVADALALANRARGI